MTADRYFELEDTIKMLCDTLPQIDPQFRIREPIRNTHRGQIERINMSYRFRMDLIKERIDRGYNYFRGYNVDGIYHQGYDLTDTSLLEYPESWVPKEVREEIMKQIGYMKEIESLARQRDKEIQDMLSDDEDIQQRNIVRQNLQKDEEDRIGYTAHYEKISELRKELREGLYSIRTVAEIVNRIHHNCLRSIEFNIAKGKIYRDILLDRDEKKYHDMVCKCGKERGCKHFFQLWRFQFTSTITINDPLIDVEKLYTIKYDFNTDTIYVKLVVPYRDRLWATFKKLQ